MKHKILRTTFGFALIASTAWIPSQKVGAVSFTSPPDNTTPDNGTGGASRGGLFTPKSGESAPRQGVGGASRTLFESNGSAPRQGVGGASRTLFESNGSAPRQGVGGASRTLFESNGSAPRRGVGGASRTLFESNGSAPRQGAGGASRTLFESNGSAPRRGVGGASRTLFESNGSAPRQGAGGASRNGLLGDESTELFSPESSLPAPNSDAGGASRDGRRYLNHPYANVENPAAILALLPQNYFGTTISQRPEILIYVPQSQAKEATFSLKDIDSNTVYEMNVPISGRAEVISINVPTELKIEKNYKWFLALTLFYHFRERINSG